MTTCLDTDVLVDCLRGTPEAQAWLNSDAGESFIVPGIAAMELVVTGLDVQEPYQRAK